MWWETKAWLPLARQKVLLSSAPQARTWRAKGQGSGSGWGANPRDRRSGSSRPRKPRTTESSARTWMGRSWTRNQSAIPASRSMASPSR